MRAGVLVIAQMQRQRSQSVTDGVAAGQRNHIVISAVADPGRLARKGLRRCMQ